MKIDETCVSLGVAIWAASGKNEFYTPDWILDRLRRNSLINPATLNGIKLAANQTPVTLKAKWLERLSAAKELTTTLPSEPLGCLYLDRKGQPARGDVFDLTWVPHSGSVGGSWPEVYRLVEAPA